MAAPLIELHSSIFKQLNLHLFSLKVRDALLMRIKAKVNLSVDLYMEMLCKGF